MPARSAQIIRYLRECYRENGNRGGIWNLFAKSVSHRLFLDGSDPLMTAEQSFDRYFLRASEASEIATQASLYQKEKDLIYASVFLVGVLERFDGKPEAVCAPLFLFPATLNTDGLEQGAHLAIDLSRRQINSPLLEAAGGEAFAREIEIAIEPNSVTEGCVGEVRRRFRKSLPEAETDSLLHYPDLVSPDELRQRLRQCQTGSPPPVALIPAAAVALVNKSTEMRGVLNELDLMAGSDSFSPPVRALFGQSPSSVGPVSIGRVPAFLSAPQEAVVESASKHALTLAVGPPGTGKSFTIAALALETLSKGGSVLIASKMDHAVDVVGEKIESSIGLRGVVTRGGKSRYLRDLKGFVEDLLAGIHTSTESDSASLKQRGNGLRKVEKKVVGLASDLDARLEKEAAWGELLSDPNPGWFRRFRQKRLRRKLEKILPVWGITSTLEDTLEEQQELTLEYLRASRTHYLRQALQRNRSELQSFSRALRARTGHRQAQYFAEMGIRNLLGALPIWLVNLSDVHRVLPLETGAFDLAIIDEATQCDIAAALPILERARRAVVTGDPKQLRHLSFLPRERQASLADQFELDQPQREAFDFRGSSLLDLVSNRIEDQERVVFLNEHFRSQPEIIGFSNREFYAGNLHVMTTLRDPEQAPGTPLERRRMSRGQRNDEGFNAREADALLASVIDLCRAHPAEKDEAAPSIGILSPFRNQVDHLREKIARHPEGATLLARHRLLMGTAHSFQGEERDWMFLSLALDDDSPAASFRFLEKPDVFNVAITRARFFQQVWHSFDPDRLPSASLLARFLNYVSGSCSDPMTEEESHRLERLQHDLFSLEVRDWLLSEGASVWLGHPLAGRRVDLVYRLNGTYRGIDLIGFPGSMAGAFPLERVLTFRRAGLPILPLPYSTWLTQQERCQAWLRGEEI